MPNSATKGELLKQTRIRAILFCIIIIFIAFLGWYGEYNSCVRSREAAKIQAYNAKQIDEKLGIPLKIFPQLQCGRVFPDR